MTYLPVRPLLNRHISLCKHRLKGLSVHWGSQAGCVCVCLCVCVCVCVGGAVFVETEAQRKKRGNLILLHFTCVFVCLSHMGPGLGSWGPRNAGAVTPLPPGPSFCASPAPAPSHRSQPSCFNILARAAQGRRCTPAVRQGGVPTPQGPSCHQPGPSCGTWLLRARPLS